MGKEIVARFDGKCKHCGGVTDEGSLVYWLGSGQGAVHAGKHECREAGEKISPPGARMPMKGGRRRPPAKAGVVTPPPTSTPVAKPAPPYTRKGGGAAPTSGDNEYVIDLRFRGVKADTPEEAKRVSDLIPLEKAEVTVRKTEDLGYQGYPNYESWLVHLHLTNTEETNTACQEVVDEAANDAPVGDVEIAVADALKNYTENLVHKGFDTLDHHMKADEPRLVIAGLVGSALQDVDWEHLARSFLSE